MRKKLFVFDLDFTLWDAGGTWSDCTIPPYTTKDGNIYDAEGAHIKLYPEVLQLLQHLKNNGKHIAIASRTASPKLAKQLMKKFDIHKYVDFEEMFPGSKTEHFIKIAAKSKYNFNEMVFFDDEYRNIEDVSLLGVECIHVTEGLKQKQVMPYL